MMSTPKAPATPASQTAPHTPQTGTWRHPRLDEITRRKNASTFGERNVRRLIWNAASLGFSFYIPTILSGTVLKSRILARTSAPFPPWTSYLLPLIQLVLSFNIFVALLPLIQRPDDLSDIPLTPSQRALLGLSATNTPLTPGSTYITPPRYQRSTPRSASGSRGTPRSRSPASAAGLRSSSAGRERESHSPFSPNASPFLQKAVGGGFTRRLSYGSQSPLSGGILLESSSGSMTPSTPTPIGGKTTSVPLSSRWLYEKGRGSPGARSLY